MNYLMILYILGSVLKFEAVFLLLPAAVGLIYKESSGLYFLGGALLCLVCGILLGHKKPEEMMLYTREGFV